MDSAKAELAEKLKAANNILVTVSRNPSVDQLSACIGLTLVLNKMGKHAAAVFSGEVPSTMEFLQPNETLEKTTDSLRDFIIALDKSKADKLRYKVEDNVVRIFITPYRTSISQADLEFSQGDFNVDVVVALGVQRQEDLDEAITMHGRILHDATVTSINTTGDGGLGGINWRDPQASSLSELVTELAQAVGPNLLDGQISTALLTGIVAETDRFSNEKTSSQTMSASAALMSAGANQQLVATKLEEPAPLTDNHDDNSQSGDGAKPPSDDQPPKNNDGTLEIDHEASQPAGDSDQTDNQSSDQGPELQLPSLPPQEPAAEEPPAPPIAPLLVSDGVSPGGKLMTDPPAMGGTLTANSEPEDEDVSVDPLSHSKAPDLPLLDHTVLTSLPSDDPAEPAVQIEEPETPEPTVPEPTPPAPEPEVTPPAPEPAPEPTPPTEPVAAPTPPPEPPKPRPAPTPMVMGLTPPPPAWVPPSDDPFNLGVTNQEPQQTLTDIEESVHSPHVVDEPTVEEDLAAARDEVNKALNANPAAPGPVQALNAQPLGGDLHPNDTVVASPNENDILPGFTADPAAHLDEGSAPALPTDQAPTPQITDPTAPPPVPPPIPFQFRPPGQ